MIYLVVYDIEDDRIRNRVASLLEGYGERRQQSVFECRLDGPALEELTGRLQGVLKKPENGEIRVYRICGNCLAASFGMGKMEPVKDEICYIV
jgi:CRISPR-associated protein Cas2